jgi:PAS domain S-box-containing protein
MFLQLIHNVALMVALSVGLQLLARHLVHRRLLYRVAAGALFGFAGVVGMMAPMQFAPGIIYDGRSIVLSLAGLFGGPVAAGIAAGACGAYRIFLGGPGALPGVLVVVEAAALGVGLHYLRRRDESWVGAGWLLAFGVVVHVGMLGLQLLLPEGQGWTVLREVGPAVMVFFPIGFLLIAVVFLQGERQRATERALRESEALQRAMIACSPLALYAIDMQGRVLTWNESARRIFGWTAEEVVGKPLPIVPEDKQQEFSALRRRVRDGESFTGVELVRQRRDGSMIEVSLAVAPLLDASGQTIGIFAAMEDITERKKLEQQLAQSQKMEAIGRLAGGLAHDFNNMLQTILGYSEMLQLELDEDSSAREHVEQVRKAGMRSAELTRQMLGFARRQTIAPRELDLNDTVPEMLKMLGRLVEEQIDILWRPCRGGCPVLIDPSQIDQLLANLVVNARDAISGVGKITIETSHVAFDEEYCSHHPGFQPGDFEMLAVSDDGEGMDRQTLDRAFEPFFTTKRKDEGTGLGLATVYGIVKQNGGFINIYSEPGEGTTVRIYLPRQEQPERTAPRPEPGQHAPTGTETVLLVEDEPALLELSKRSLERLGYQVLAAGNPEEAISIMEHQGDGVDLLMTDVVMPQMNGRDLWTRLSERWHPLPCLFMSGYTDNVIVHHGVLDEGAHFLQKPFSQADLARRVREALNGE